MSTNPPSFRLPFILPDGDEDAKVHPAVAQAIRYCFNGLLDINQAIPLLKTQIGAATASTASSTTNTVTAGGGTSSSSSGAGTVNQQSANYTLQSSDFGALIVMSGAVLTLNNAVGTPFYVVIENAGGGNLTLTSTAGSVNLNQLISDQSALAFFDGLSWWITTLPDYLLGGATGSGAVVLDSGCTLVNASFTGLTKIQLSVFSNNTAAIAGGLTTGDLYRLGGDPDLVATVH